MESEFKTFRCDNCGTYFQSKCTTAKYCSDDCRAKAKREKQKARWANATPEQIAKKRAQVQRHRIKHADAVKAYNHDYYERVIKPARAKASEAKLDERRKAKAAAKAEMALREETKRNIILEAIRKHYVKY